MELANLSSDGVPRLSLVEPFISSLVLCSAWLGGLEFKWAPLTSVSHVLLHRDAVRSISVWVEELEVNILYDHKIHPIYVRISYKTGGI